MIIKKANRFLLLSFLLLSCSRNETGVIEKKIEIIKTDFLTFARIMCESPQPRYRCNHLSLSSCS